MTNRRTRQVLAVVAVTTALCADQVVRAAPASASSPSRTQVSELAGRIVQRLTVSFRRTVADAAPVRPQTRATERCTVDRPETAATVRVEHRPVSPFQFRLPPPTVA
jgi:hypothetical protein